MPAARDLLLEIGTEELPPKALRTLMNALAESLAVGLTEGRLAFSDLRAYASPRRLAVIVRELANGQTDQVREHKGPPVSVAFDDAGSPTPAALAFARKLGVAVSDLGRSETEKGAWLSYSATEQGVLAAELLPGIVQQALDALPIPRPMRWGDTDVEFVRPVHWIVLLHGDEVVPGNILGVNTGNLTRGHRFMAPDPIQLSSAADYVLRLEDEGYVVVDFAERRARVEQQVASVATSRGGLALTSDALLDEVAALVEWPVAVGGSFDEAYLALPREVIIATLTGHQRYFPIENAQQQLLPSFVTLANLESKDPDQVISGNERVVQPRLADAMFFWNSDRATPLIERRESLDAVVYQKGLGSIGDKVSRLEALAARIADETGADSATVERSAALSKCDLVTGLVGEFPELQGTMGGYYAAADDEAEDVCAAIAQQYWPRFAGDDIPSTDAGRVLSIADRLDTLCGIFALGKKPSGNRDPFGLRRAALGIVRTIVEGKLEIDLPALIEFSLRAQPVSAGADCAERIYDYVVERMRVYALEREEMKVEMFDAVRVRQPRSLLDFDARLNAVSAFVALPSAETLAAANKRIGNILKKAAVPELNEPDAALFEEEAEHALHVSLLAAREAVEPLLAKRQYSAALERLAELREAVDQYFDNVMVMTDDESLRLNRLALLSALRDSFLKVADISRLAIK